MKIIIFLSFFTMLGKIMGVVYKIPLSNILGSEGMGLFQIVFPLFVIAITISSSGVSTAVTKMVATNKKNDRGVLIFAIKTTLILSFVFMVLFLSLSRVLSVLQGNSNVSLVYYGVASGIFVISILAVYRGYIRGNQNIKIYAISEFIEQSFKLIFGLGFAVLFARFGVVYAVLGSFVGLSFSALVSLVFCIIYRPTPSDVFNGKIDRTQFFNYTIFGTLTTLIIPISQFVDTIIVIKILQFAGENSSLSTSLFGIYAGVVATVINLPISLIIALETIALPSISRTISSRETTDAKIRNIIFYTLLISIASSILLYIFSNEIIGVLYSKGLTVEEMHIASRLLKIGAFSVIFLSLVQISTVVFQSIGRFYFPFISLAIGSVIKLIIQLILVPSIGIYGAQFAIVIDYAFVCLLNFVVLFRIGVGFGNYKVFLVLVGNLVFGIVSFALREVFSKMFSAFFVILFSGMSLLLIVLIIAVIYLSLSHIKGAKSVLRKR